jgi:hypothetical protein
MYPLITHTPVLQLQKTKEEASYTREAAYGSSDPGKKRGEGMTLLALQMD